MARTVTTALRNAIDIDGSYRLRIKAEVHPSRVYFEDDADITEDHPVSGADAKGILIDPMKQDIEYNATPGGLVTFYVSGSTLYYAVQGNGTGNSLGQSATAKPGVLGSKLYAGNGSTLSRYSINWGGISISSDGNVGLGHTIEAAHAVSSTECIALIDDESGLRPVYWDGSGTSECPSRFMFHLAVKPTPKTDKEIREGKIDDTRTLIQKAIHSGAAKLGTKIFVYVTNAFSGMVEGCYYDLDTSAWSSIFTVLPTDLQVSLCEFRIANVFEHNGTLYIAGLFHRTDTPADTAGIPEFQPHSLLLYSENGRTFSINRNTLVSDIGYRFLARVGGNNLYLANCNRVCYAPVTWLFDGKNGTAGSHVDISEDDIKGFGDNGLQKGAVTLRSGKLEYFPEHSPYVVQGARLIVKIGYDVVPGGGDGGTDISWVTYATYIIDNIDYQLGVGRRGTVINAVNEAQWNLSGLSMPFYAELLGKSCYFDPMLQGTSMLSSAGNGCLAHDSFSVDFWNSEGYSGGGSFTPVDMTEDGGLNYHEASGAHNCALITRDDIATKLGLSDNPVITSESISANVYGWSHTTAPDDLNDEIGIIVVTVDDEGNESERVATLEEHFPNTYYTAMGGYDPIVISVNGLTIGHKIKKVGVSFQSATTTWFNVARVDFTSGVRAYYPLYGADTLWETEEKWGYYKLPRYGKPFIMITTGPYDAFNFSLAGRFKDSHNAADTIIHSYAGLIGHCKDGLNYTAARYCKQHNTVQLVICRDGIETVLKESATVAYTVLDASGNYQMRFDHRDGYFEIYMYDITAGAFREVLGGYTWEAADGYMCMSDIVSKRSGIYGYVDTPIARILGYNNVGDESGTTADGIPFDPLWDPTTFPTGGKARIMDNIYEYNTRVAHPAIPRGPYQFRQMNDYSKIETDYGPLGDGPGLDARDFDWTGGTDHPTLNDGYLIALNNGVNFKCNGTEWQVWTETSGQVWLRNRMRYYSANAMIGKTYNSLANKVWIVGGLLGSTDPVKLVNGKKAAHTEGNFVTYEPADGGEILCYWYIGSGGEDDTTIGDLMQKVCDLSGARCSFPGDYTDASQAITTSPQDILTVNYAEGFDLSFEVASFGAGSNLSIRFNATLNPDNYENKDAFEDDTALILNIAHTSSGLYKYTLSSYDSNTQIYSTYYQSNTGLQKFRIMLMKDNVGIYQNGRWVTTIPLDEIVYQNSLTITLYASTSITLSNIRETDLSDWREAIYIDLETDGTSALNSIMQQRPVEMHYASDGSISFAYEPTRHTITAVRKPRTHRYIYSVPTEGASDAIIYGLKDVKTIVNLGFAKELGFATKMMRMPDLGVGAIRATHVALWRMLENFHRHDMTIRPDLELEPGDIYSVTYTLVGSDHTETRQVIIDSVTFDYRMSGTKITGKMTISGREVYTYGSTW